MCSSRDIFAAVGQPYPVRLKLLSRLPSFSRANLRCNSGHLNRRAHDGIYQQISEAYSGRAALALISTADEFTEACKSFAAEVGDREQDRWSA
jgi:hypothetical protein